MDLLKISEAYYKPLPIELPGRPKWIASQINSRRGIDFSLTVKDDDNAEQVARRFLVEMVRVRPDGDIRLKAFEDASPLDPVQVETLDRQSLTEAVRQYLSASADRLDSALTPADDTLDALKTAFISLRLKQYGRGPGYLYPDSARLEKLFGRGFSHSLRALQRQSDLLRYQPERTIGAPPFRFRHDDDEVDHSTPNDPPTTAPEPLIDTLEHIRTIQQRQVDLQANAIDLMSKMLMSSTDHADSASKYAMGAVILTAASLIITIILGMLTFIGSRNAARDAQATEQAAQIERQRMVNAIDSLASQAAVAEANEAARHAQSIAQGKEQSEALVRAIEQRSADDSKGKSTTQQRAR
jgi:hypothetical protein